MAAGLVLLAALLIWVDSDALLAQFTNLRPGLLTAAAACIVVATLLGSYNAYLVVAIDTPVPFARFLSFYWFSWALGLVVPGQVGDVASLTYLMKRTGLDWTKIIGRALLDKLISFAIMIVLAGVALLRFSANLSVEKGTFLSAAAIVVAVAIVAVLVAIALFTKTKRGNEIRARFLEGAIDVMTFARAHPGLVAINLLGTTIKILMIGTAYWYVFMAGGATNPPWLDIVLLVTVSSLVAYIPVSFNGLGTVEITGILLFSLLGLGEELVLSSYLVLRATVMLIAWMPSLLILAWSGKEHR